MVGAILPTDRHHPLPALACTLTLLLAATWAAPALGLPAGAAAQASPAQTAQDPLVPQQWYLGWREGTVSQDDGRHVTVGVLDTGVDATHPEIEESYDASRSRSFLTSGCGGASTCPDLDPAQDPRGHGTAVAGLVTADVDGHGIVGAAPGATVVSLRAGDASGTFYADAVSRAVRYAADINLDILVMSFTTDPWFRYCADAPADTPEERRQQGEDLDAVTSALRYAADRGVIMVAAAGNEAFDLDHGTTDPYSRWSGSGDRPVTDRCVTMPAQSEHVITVGALDAAGARADYSNVGAAVDITAPGGASSAPGTEDTTPGTEILTTVPAALVQELLQEGEADVPGVVSDCSEGRERCRYYAYMTGTSLAAPLVAAAAATLLSYGVTAQQVPGLLLDLASPTPCPAPPQELACREAAQAPGSANTWYGHGSLRLPAVLPVGGGAGHGR